MLYSFIADNQNEWDLTNMFSSIGKRIEARREEKGLTQQGLANLAGISVGHVSRIERDKEENPRLATISAIAAALEIEVTQLLKGIEPSHEVMRASRPDIADDAPSYTPNDIPEVGLAKAGRGGFFDDSGNPPSEWTSSLHRPADVTDRNAYAVAITGDSMEPVLRTGSRVVCVTDREAKPGDWVVVQMKSGEVMIKELSQRDGMILLKSINPLHEPIMVHKKDVRAIHPVVWIKRK